MCCDCEPETRVAVIYYKDAGRGARETLGEREHPGGDTRIYNIAGITPAFSARELVEAFEERIPDAPG